MESENEQKELFERAPIGAALKKMIVPTIFSQVIVLIYNMADTFYVGQTGNAFMVAGVSLILPVFNIAVCLSNLSGVGGGTLVSRLLGTGRDKEAGKAACFSIWLAILVSFLLSLIVGGNLLKILGLLGADADTLPYARQYVFCVIVLGAVPTVLSNVLSNLLRSTGRSKDAGIGIAGGGILNMILDPLFMFVLLPEGSEVLGVGIATLISNCCACLYFFSVLYRIRKHSILTLNPKVGCPGPESIRNIFYIGVPAALTMFLFDLDYIIIDRLMASYDNFALAAIGIVLKVERLPLNVGIGICQGMVPLVAYNFASQNYDRMNRFVRLSLKVGLIVAAASITLYELFAVQIVHFFIQEAQTSAYAVPFLRIRVLATPFMFLCFFTVHSFQAFGKGHISLLLGVMRWAALNIPLLFLLNHIFGMYGIVWTQVTADSIMALLSLFIYSHHQKTLVPVQNKQLSIKE